MKKVLQAAVMLAVLVALSYIIYLIPEHDSTKKGNDDQTLDGPGYETLDGSIYKELRITAFDIGKADCFFIQAGDTSIMIDTGEKNDSEKILSYLDKNSVSSLDYLIITHFDKDHVGGAADVIEQLDVGQVIQPDYMKESKQFQKYAEALQSKGIEPVRLHEPLKLSVNDIVIDVDPPTESSYSEENDFSLICTLHFKDTKFLFMGDAEEIRIAEYLEKHSGHIDFIKMPGHGRYNSLIGNLVKKIDPKYALITCSEKEPANNETLRLLNLNNVNTYLTSAGDIEILTDGKEIKINQADY